MSPEQRGRPPVLTLEAIAEAAVAIGFEQLTMAAIRARLGVGETTLYRYVPDRDALVRLALERVLADASWPSTDQPWRPLLEEHALALWRLLGAHPGAAAEVSRGIAPISYLGVADSLCSALEQQGFTPEDAALACDIVVDLVVDNRRGVDRDLSGRSARDQYAATLEHTAMDMDDDARRIRTAIERTLAVDPLEWFRRKLQVVLRGLEATRSAR